MNTHRGEILKGEIGEKGDQESYQLYLKSTQEISQVLLSSPFFYANTTSTQGISNIKDLKYDIKGFNNPYQILIKFPILTIN